MKTRENFLRWAFQVNIFEPSSIDKRKFYNIHEQKYVLDILERKSKEEMNFSKVVKDYLQLENQRYAILDISNISIKSYNVCARKAIQFCAKTKVQKRKSSFMMNPNLSNYLAKSLYPWDNSSKESIEINEKHYFFIPSFISVEPKEIILTGLNTLLLDLINYQEVFSYQEFFDLVSASLDLPEKELDQMLIDFISDQILYYQTIHLADN